MLHLFPYEMNLFIRYLILAKLLCFPNFVSTDITSPATYHPKSYIVRLEVNHTEYRMIDFPTLQPLITVVDLRKDIYIFGRLIVALNQNETKNMKSDLKNGGACTKIVTPGEDKWIAVILQGGSCTIKQKLNNVFYESNASAAIILDNVLARNIDKYEYDNKIGLLLSPNRIPVQDLMNESIVINANISINIIIVDGVINRTSVLFVSISFILLMIISLVWLTFYYIQRFRYMHAKERLSRRLANAAKKALNKIPVKILSSDDKEVSYDYDQCAICIDNYQVGETIRILPCKHIFHKICIDSWLIEQRSCPMCKVDILKACGILSVSSNKNSNNRPNPLLETGIISSDPETGESSTFDVAESTVDNTSRCRRGQSSFLQRYRDRYGLHHYYQGHIRNHCHKYTGHCHRRCVHHCSNHKDKFNPVVEIGIDVTTMLHKSPNMQIDAERADLISESENSIASLHQMPFHLPVTKEEIKSEELTKNCEELREISQGLICDICECTSENTPLDCDICSSLPNHSSSISCSCESCDCYFVDRECRHFNESRHTSAGIGNLLGCCVTSRIDGDRQNIRGTNNQTNSGFCCYNPCSQCRNRSLGNSHIENEFEKCHGFKQCSLKSHCKMSNNSNPHNVMASQLTDNLININQFAKTNNTKPYLPRNGTRKIEMDNAKQLKSIQLTKNLNKCATIDSYTKSSMSDEFDYEADGGSSSLEIGAPMVKLTVLPPQVQYHQGSPNSDSSNSSSKTTEVKTSDNFSRYEEYQESETSKTDSIVPNLIDNNILS